MADQLAGQWYADVTGLGDLVAPARVDAALRTIHARNVCGFAGGRSGPVNGTRPDGSVDRSSEQSEEVWVGTAYALAAFMIGRGLVSGGLGDRRGHRPGHVRARTLVPDARGIRRARRLPGVDVPPAARDLGDRGRPHGASGRGRRSGAAPA